MPVTIYGLRSGADTYHSDRGNAAWAAAGVTDRDTALARGSDYIDGRYRRRLRTGAYTSLFPGAKTGGRSQEREWPRTGASDGEGNAIPSDEVPDEVIRATYEAALRELAAPGSLSPDFTPNGRIAEVEAGSARVKYAEPRGGDAMRNPSRPIVPVIDEILAPLLQGGSVSLGVAVDVV